jgi:hypothetical protein
MVNLMRNKPIARIISILTIKYNLLILKEVFGFRGIAETKYSVSVLNYLKKTPSSKTPYGAVLLHFNTPSLAEDDSIQECVLH